MAGKYTTYGLISKHFLAIHLSGGTSELLDVRDTEDGFNISILGDTQDLHAGQFVDRIGVAMGLPFPAGPYLEQLALQGKEGKVVIPSFVRGTTIGFSGAETHALRILNSGENYADIALGVYLCLSKTLEKWIKAGANIAGASDVLLVGGVSSSSILRNRLISRFNKGNEDIRLYFAEPSVSKDSAVGTALLGLKKYKRRIKNARTDY
jgi:Glycoprotease family.